jgi:ribonuclease P protein component
MVLTMKRVNRLLSNRDFQRLIKINKNVSNKSFIVFYQPNQLGHPRVGISTSNKLGGAVIRNKIRRQIRMMVSQNLDLNQQLDILVIVRSNYTKLNFKSNLAEFLKLTNKLKEVD